MTREEYFVELTRIQKTGDGPTLNRLMNEFDATARKLGYVSALQKTVSDLIEDNVAKDVRIQTLEAQLRAAGEHSGGDIEGDSDE